MLAGRAQVIGKPLRQILRQRFIMRRGRVRGAGTFHEPLGEIAFVDQRQQVAGPLVIGLVQQAQIQ